jgi:LysR family transcriptional regulator, benzoate and cis,cis-muconate-responsive activator of ben and cat genes
MYSVLPPALEVFHPAFPDVELKPFEMITEEQADALREVQPIEGCSTIPLLRDHMMIVLPPDHRLARRKTIRI